MVISLIDQAAALRMVTGLGDPVFLLSSMTALFAYFWAMRARGVALAWAESLALCGVMVVVAKLGFHTCGGEWDTLQIRSPSGHTALAVTFYGCAAVLLARGRRGPPRLGLGLAAVLLIAGVGASRVILGMHSAPEVLAGFLIGAAALALFILRMARSAHPTPPLAPMVALVAGLALLTHGLHVDVETVIAGVSHRFQSFANLCLPDVRTAARRGLPGIDPPAMPPRPSGR